MGSPLGPTLANAFLCMHETGWLSDCPAEYKPVYYRRYVDDIFVLFKSPDHLQPFVDYMNSKHQNIHFTSDHEKNNTFSFLDVGITKENQKFNTDVFRKETFSGVYTNFSSFIPEVYKSGLISTLLFRSFTLVSNFNKFHLEIVKLKEMLKKNGYPEGVFDKCVRMFLNKLYIPKKVFSTAPKLDIQIVLPFLGSTSLYVKRRLQRALSSNFNTCKFSFVFKSTNRLSTYFKFKDSVPKALKSCLVYKFTCG